MLAARGAYGALQSYSQGDIKNLVAHANARGVRVVPELDMPAHTARYLLVCVTSTTPVVLHPIWVVVFPGDFFVPAMIRMT